MAKLEKLTPAQERKKEEIKQHWLDYLFSCKNSTNKEAAKVGIDWLYKLAGKKEPVVIYVDSPAGCQIAVSYLKEFVKRGFFEKNQVWAQVGAQVGDQIRAQVRAQVWDQVWAQVGDQVWAQVRDQVWDQVWAQVGAQVGDQVWDQVRAQVGDQVWAQVRAQVGAQVRAQVGDQKMEFENFSSNGNIWDYGWVSFYDFFQTIGIIDHAEYKSFKSLLLSGIYDMIQLNGFCIVSNLPDKISRNAQNRLHSENGSAIHFRDGYELYFWNGIAVPKEWILNKNSISNETIINEKNAEKRRCLMEILGIEKFTSVLGVKQIDADVDQHGNKIILYSTKQPDPLLNEYIHFVKVICPSTDREYMLCVPNTITNSWEAIAFTFSKSKKDYKPVFET